jgi:hypothetical protein
MSDLVARVMAEKEDVRQSQGESNDEYIPPAIDMDNENEHSPSPQATQIPGSEPAIGKDTENKGDVHLNANTSEDQLHNVPNDSQVSTKLFRQCSLCLSARYFLE